MNILIAGALDPFAYSNEKSLSTFIADYYKKEGHSVDVCYLPFKMDYQGIHEQILAYRLLTTYPAADLLIAVGYPAFALKHPQKYTFLFELLPEFHSQYNTEYGFKDQYYRIEQDQKKVANLVRTEKICLHESKEIFCSSETLKKDLLNIGCSATVFSYVSMLLGTGHKEAQGSWLVESVIEPMDRLDIILDAFVTVPAENLYIFIPEADPAYLNAVEARIKRLKLTEHVFVIRDEINKEDLLSCKGVICLRHMSGYCPSYILHAAFSQVPCIVAKDGGALCEISAKQTVVEVKPTVESLSGAITSACYKNIQSRCFEIDDNDALVAILNKLVK